MSGTPRLSSNLPPHLSMDEYVDFIEASRQDINTVLAARQKDIEKRVTRPFRIPPEPRSTSEADGATVCSPP